MQVAKSSFLEDSKPFLKRCLDSLSQDFACVSVLGTDVSGIRYRVQKSETSVQDSIWCERGFVIRVYDGTGYSEYSFDEVPGDRVEADSLIAAVRTRFTSSLERLSSLARNPTARLSEEPLAQSWQGEVARLPSPEEAAEVILKLTSLRDRALGLAPEMVDIRIIYEGVTVRKLFLSDSRDLEQAYTWSQGYLMPLFRRDEQFRYTLQPFSGLKGSELLEEMEDALAGAVEEAKMLLQAGRIEPGEYEVICSPEVAGLLAHEAFGHGVEADMFVKRRARAAQYLGKEVASPLVSLHDGAGAAREVASFFFDDEGTLAQDSLIIERGILKRGISDLLSALQLGTPPTGNGRRESFERKAYARMTNTFFAPGGDELSEMIGSIRHGYLLEKFLSGMEDPKNWGIQCLILYAREIRDGRLTGKIVSPVLMTGYVPDLLQAISMVSREIKLSGSGMCGKGHKERVKTSTGGPYLKTRARLG